ncbi:MAG TPA: hypothetical protein VKR43_02890 [Bryobacteraceae bacterium]|nr:hypothetical protein [Bryobacteraceae bacterium]
MTWRFVYSLMALCLPVWAQQTATNTVGLVTRIDAAEKQIVLKTDAGVEVTVSLQPTASFRRVAPGENDLRNAATIALADINAGDRVLARGRASEDQKTVAATLVVVMSQADIAKKQASERADWDKRGVIGVVTAVSPSDIAITVRGAGASKPLIITPAPNAQIRRYASESTKFTDAKPSTLTEIRTGDQVRALGDKNEDGTKMTAQEIVSGSFRELAATILSIDAAKGELRVNDLASKRPVVLKINADSNLRKLPAQMAQMMAARNRPPEPGGGREARPAAGPEGRGGNPEGRAGRGPGGRGDLTQMLDRIPKVTLADLKTGDAIIVLSTVGSAQELTAITMLAGVEPILTKPGTKEMELGSWSLGGVGGDAGTP